MRQDFSDNADLPAYHKLVRTYRERVGYLEDNLEMLNRDKFINTPDAAQPYRIEIQAALSKAIQTFIDDTDFETLIENAIAENLSDTQIRMVEEIEIDIQKRTAITADMRTQAASIESQGRPLHAKLKGANDWDAAKDWLKDVVAVKRRIGAQYAKEFGLATPYDGLLAQYSPGFNAAEIDALFADLLPAIRNIKPDPQKQNTAPFSHPPISQNAQLEIYRGVLKAIGFDLSRGDIYMTDLHPVEGGLPDDTRLIISHGDEENILKSYHTAIHEAGHGLYFQGLPAAHAGTALGRDAGTPMQESQALLYDMIIGRSPEFMTHLSALIKTETGQDILPADLHTHITRTQDGPIRTQADEVNYHKHIAIRYDIEKRLINGDIEIDDLPAAWNTSYKQYFGAAPKNYSEGVLQDVHWSVGKFGYFPSYTLGHMIAAQIYDTLQTEFPDIKQKMKDGNLGDVCKWLNQNVHEKGRLETPKDLIINTTGKALSANSLITHLENRYGTKTPAPAQKPQP